MLTRRALLSLPAAGLAARVSPAFASTPAATLRDSSFDPWVEINPAHLAHNAREVSRLIAGRPILAVVKNNGYGLGVAHAARGLARLREVHGVAVIKLHEAVTLREGGVREPILLMGPFDEADLAEAHARDIMPMVYTPIGDVLERLAARTGRPVHVHVKVDAGLGRVGVPYRDAAALVRDLAGRGGVIIEGVMMTFTEDAAFDRELTARYAELTRTLRRDGVPIGRRHAASSYTLFQAGEEAHLDMVRPGMVLYGVYPDASFRATGRLDLRPALAFRARVAYVKKLGPGESAGYERAFRATRDTWLATLPVGHADGWPRAAARGARVRINGRLYPVVGSVSASHTLVNVGEEPAVRIGDVVTLFDWEDGSRPEDVAAACGASVYDLTMHLGALLPRREVTA